jgi:hypothetical protein
MNIDAVAAPMTLVAGFAEPATEGRKTGIKSVNTQTKSHIPLKEIFNRSNITDPSFCNMLDTERSALFLSVETGRNENGKAPTTHLKVIGLKLAIVVPFL